MDPYSLTHQRTPRKPITTTRFYTMRSRLQVIANQVDDDGKVFVNGETFTGDEFRFILTCLQPPVPTPKAK